MLQVKSPPKNTFEKFDLPKKYYDRYDYEALAREHHLTAEQVAEDVMKALG
jgi:1-deoxy-D-xylulose-5-phosphate synthase